MGDGNQDRDDWRRLDWLYAPPDGRYSDRAELGDTTFAFTDISEHNLDMVTQLCRRDIDANDLPATIEATTDRRARSPTPTTSSA